LGLFPKYACRKCSKPTTPSGILLSFLLNLTVLMLIGRGRREWAVKKARIELGKGVYIVRGGFRFLGGKVDIAAVVGDKNVLFAATRFHGQLTGEVRRREIVAGNSTDDRGGQSKEVGSRESQREGVEERREASAREGWKGGVLEERRFFLTTSR
jgi:hypothetical protein